MTRILYVITKATMGGAQRYVLDLACAARERGFDVALAYGEPGLLAERAAALGIRTIRARGLQRDVGFFAELTAFIALVRLFQNERPDIVHLNSSKAGAVGALAARIARVPRIVFTAHGWAFHESRPAWQKLLFRIASGSIVLFSDTVLCVSNATRRAIAWIPFSHRKLIVVHNGISCPPLLPRETARAAIAPRAVGRYWIGMASELHPTKRVEDAIRAMKIIAAARPDALLVVLGEGQEREKLVRLIGDLGLRERVALVGFKPDAAMLMSAFDLFLHSSQSEAFAYALLEAGCASLPVVATRAGGIPEIIPDDDHGILVPPHTPEALAAAVLALMDDPRRAHELAARLHARVTTEFTMARMRDATLAAYAR